MAGQNLTAVVGEGRAMTRQADQAGYGRPWQCRGSAVAVLWQCRGTHNNG